MHKRGVVLGVWHMGAGHVQRSSACCIRWLDLATLSRDIIIASGFGSCMPAGALCWLARAASERGPAFLVTSLSFQAFYVLMEPITSRNLFYRPNAFSFSSRVVSFPLPMPFTAPVTNSCEWRAVLPLFLFTSSLPLLEWDDLAIQSCDTLEGIYIERPLGTTSNWFLPSDDSINLS